MIGIAEEVSDTLLCNMIFAHANEAERIYAIVKVSADCTNDNAGFEGIRVVPPSLTLRVSVTVMETGILTRSVSEGEGEQFTRII
jgi:hypothetical protein